MGGLQFFCTTMEQPEGNVDLLEYCMAGANKEVEPDAEERKGGSGHIGKMLLSAGNTHLALVAYVPTEEMLAIEGFDEDIVEALRQRAKDALLTRALVSEEKFEQAEPADDLLNMDGMDRDLAVEMASKGIVTMEDLAEQAVDDLLDIEGMDEERAAQLIMTARAPWFEGEEAGE